MKRRDFLNTAAVVGAIGAMPLATRLAHAGTDAPAARFVLVRSSSATPGAPFEPLDEVACTHCDVESLRVRIDGLHVASAAPVLQSLWLSAMFDRPGLPAAPFLAWHFEQGPRPRMSQRVSFVAARDRMRGFELEYRLADGGACRSEACALTRFTAPLLAPGHYALLGPRRDGSRVEPSGLRHSGDVDAPLASSAAARDFDYLAFRVEAIG